MVIRTNLEGNVCTLTVEGRIDMLNSTEFQQKTDDAVAKLFGKSGTLIMDFHELKYISSAGLRVILSCYKQMTKNNGALTIINVSPEIMEILEITGFNGFMDISSTEVGKK